MTALKAQIAAFDEKKAKQVPQDILTAMTTTTNELKSSELENNSLKTGQRAPDFNLPNQNGVAQSLAGYLHQSLVVLSFYRGGWCPYCNMELNALQKQLPEIQQAGAQLVAISPETPDNSLSTHASNTLAFDILYDQGNQVAQSFGLVFALSPVLRPIYKKLDIDIPTFNGDDTFELPMPATYIINQQGEILYHYIDADYTKRSEPAEIVTTLKSL